VQGSDGGRRKPFQIGAAYAINERMFPFFADRPRCLFHHLKEDSDGKQEDTRRVSIRQAA